ncbi:hydrogenase maturation protease HycI [Methanobrevibacter olleyae]|uniref:Hydrogenase maturation protease HycI n=2 Tax=Methanobrevibacter olleyae TaxID=294671 RepID=A0A126QYN2_METOL|nr:hydrogenase maturation protease HycI [Methanobrevibacter olleyae]
MILEYIYCDKMLNNFDKISEDIDLFLENCDSLLILGIGNDIRGDDGLGPYIINQLSLLKESILNNPDPANFKNNLNQNEPNNLDKNEDFFDNVCDINTGNIPLDDGLNSYICELNVDVNESLKKRLNKTFLIDGGSVPENFTGLIKKFNPSHIIIVDASLMNKEAGEINIVNKDNIVDISISTHSMSLAYLIKYLELENEFEILFIGIEPKIMDLSFELSDIVKETSDLLVKLLFSKILNI